MIGQLIIDNNFNNHFIDLAIYQAKMTDIFWFQLFKWEAMLLSPCFISL